MVKKRAIIRVISAASAAGVCASILARAGYRSRRPVLRGDYQQAPVKVLIVGGGFGGLAAARELARLLGGSACGASVGVALLDLANYTTFWPMVPSAIAGDVEVRHAAHAIRRVTRPLGVEFYQARVESIDLAGRSARTDVGEFPYDYLILAPGSRTAFPGVWGARENALELKSLTDALHIRNTVIDRFEEAERLRGRHGGDLLTFVFVGGGPTAVEGAANCHDLIFDVLQPDYPAVDFSRVRVVLVNHGERILKGLDPALANAASHRLRARRIEVIDNAGARDVRPGLVTLSTGAGIPSRTVVWAAGIEPPELLRDLDLPKDSRGNLLADEFLAVRGHAGVYAVGDSAGVETEGDPVPALAQAAEQEGAVAARNVAAGITGGERRPFRYRSLGQLVDLGATGAVASVLGVRVSGALGALVWKGVYLHELGYNLNRAQVLADWAIDLVSRPDTSKIFEE